jgi:hypothetical protein
MDEHYVSDLLEIAQRDVVGFGIDQTPSWSIPSCTKHEDAPRTMREEPAPYLRRCALRSCHVGIF